MAKEEKKQKARRPTAEKREIQNAKRRTRNRVVKSRVRTAIRHFEAALGKSDLNSAQPHLNEVYSLMDKGVKNGIYKKNKAGRVKSRLTARLAALKT